MQERTAAEATFRPPEPHLVFNDPSGRRIRLLRGFAWLAAFVVSAWVAEFAFRVHGLAAPIGQEALARLTPPGGDAARQGAAITEIQMRPGSDVDCGQGVFWKTGSPPGVDAFIPYGDATALAGLSAHCRNLGAVYYEAFAFGAPGGQIRALGAQSSAFPLAEFRDGWKARNRPQGFAVLRPVDGLSAAGLEQIFTEPTRRADFEAGLASLDLDGVDGGLCLDLSRQPGLAAAALLPVLSALRARLAGPGLATCLIGAADAGIWADPAVVALTDRVVALAFQTTASPTVPPAPRDWTGAALAEVRARIPAAKLSIGYGTFGTAWQSGDRQPRRISFGEAMLRASEYGGEVSFGAELGNTGLRYLDAGRRLVQVWLLDALSFHNQRLQAGAAGQAVLWPIGYEDPAIWRLLAAPVGDPVPLVGGMLDLSDQSAVQGSGPFSGFISAAAPGQRRISVAPSGQIVGQVYDGYPRPHRIGYFGDEGPPGQLALSFDGLGSGRALDDLLDLLAREEISATFFVSTRDLILAGGQVPRVLAAGHAIGSMTYARRSQGWLGRGWSQFQNNLTQHLLAHDHGLRARLVRNPAHASQVQGDVAAMNQLQELQSAGYLPVYASLAAPYGRVDVAAFLARAQVETLARPLNVLAFDFSPGNDRPTLQALPQILAALKQEGLVFADLPGLAGQDTASLLPQATLAPVVRDDLTYRVMRISWIGVQNTILLLALIVALRSPIYLLLALLRRRNAPVDPSYHPPLTVIVPAYNEEAVIERTVESILASDYPDLRVYVVDDGSSDRTAEVEAKRFGGDPRVSLFRESNHGKWYAIDNGVFHTFTPFIVVVDADTLLAPDALKLLVQPFRDPRVGAVAGTVEVGNRVNLLTAFQALEYLHTQEVMRRAYETVNGLLVVPGAIGAWRTEAMHKAGEVSGDTITEDADLTVAVHRAGYRVAYQPAAKAFTEAPETVRGFLRQRLRWSFGMFQVSWKHKRAVIEGHPVGFISLVDAVWYSLITSLIYPVLDAILLVAGVYWLAAFAAEGLAAFNGFPLRGFLAYVLLLFMDLFNVLVALAFAGRFELVLVAVTPLVRFLYRPLLYISSIKSISRALTGRLSGWSKLERTGQAHIGT